MIIQADEEGKKLIQSLCGVAVESIGSRVMPLVNTAMMVMKDMPPQGESISEKLKKMGKVAGKKPEVEKPAEVQT